MSKTKELIVDYRKKWAEQVPINIDGAGVEREFQVPWCPHHQQTMMVVTYQDSHEEGMKKHFPPQETEKIWHGSPDPKKVLQLHH